MTLSRFLPILDWLRHYPRAWLSADIVAGLTTAAVIIPKAMAYATVAGLPVEVGIYTALVPMVVYAVLGTSRPLSTSTSTTLGILTAAALARAVPTNDPAMMLTAAATLACMVGAILIAASLLRLGFIADFISDPVLTGFKAGIGLVIVVDQIPKLLGIHLPRSPFLHELLGIAQHIPDASLPTVAVGLAMLILLIGMRRRLPHIPAPLVAVAGGIAASWFFGFSRIGVETVGHIPAGLPHFHLPDIDLAQALLPSAFGIALMSFTEAIAAARAFADSDDPPLDANQELLATGAANLAGGLFGGMPAGGGTSQTAVNRLAGARTQLAELVTAAAAAATLLVLAPLIGLMPEATLAAVVVVYSIGLIKPQELHDILKVRRMEFFWALTACIGVVFLGTLQGIVAAVAVSLLAMVHQANNPRVYAVGRIVGTDIFQALLPVRESVETFPGLLIIRTEGRIYFGNAHVVGTRIENLTRQAAPKVVLFDMGAIPDIEYTAIKMLTERTRRLLELGVEVWLSNLNPDLHEIMARTPLVQRLGQDRIFLNRQEAVTHYLEKVAQTNRPATETTSH